jgi:hypothetical protein
MQHQPTCNLVSKANDITGPMGFAYRGLWGMGYHGLMGYGMSVPTNQLGNHDLLWVTRGYGLSEVWVKRGSTVYM